MVIKVKVAEKMAVNEMVVEMNMTEVAVMAAEIGATMKTWIIHGVPSIHYFGG